MGFGCEGIADDLVGYTKRRDVLSGVYEWLRADDPVYLPGDLDDDGLVTPVDVTMMVRYVYIGDPVLGSLDAMDVNADCMVNPLDVAFVVNYVYKSLGELQPGCVL